MRYSIRELKNKISSKILTEEFEITNHNVCIGMFVPKIPQTLQNRFKSDDKVFQVKPTSVSRASSEVLLKKNVVKKPILQGKFGNCKVCGSGLTEWGDFCIGKGRHKQ